MKINNILAIIPARGGSKGIIKKNIVTIAGKPLIAHTIGNALESKTISRTIVSTDDEEIAEISQFYGAEIILRPHEISNDSASSESALLHALYYLKKIEDYEPDLIVFLQCTSPLTSFEDIDGTVNLLLEEQADTAFTATDFHYFIWKRDDNGEAFGINHEKKIRQRRQERELQYVETGAVYVMRYEGFLQAKHRFFGKTIMNITPPERHWEIDTPIDLKIAEVLMQEQICERKCKKLPDSITGVVLDFDGVFTNNKVIVFQDGREAVICDRGDGLGISQLKQLKIPLLVLSTEKNPVVTVRCDKLDIHCLQNVPDKLSALKKWIQENNIEKTGLIFVGNDLNDLECIKYVGCGIAVGDAYPIVKSSAKIILSSNGGNGAIRELIQLILKKQRNI